MQLAEVTDILAVRERRQARRVSDFVPTGSMGLDIALSGGWRKARFSELSGDYSTYKSSLVRHTVAEAQRGGPVLWIDGDGSFDSQAAANAGVRLDELAVGHPNSAIHALDMIRETAPFFDLIVVDGASQLTTSRENWEQEFGWTKAEMVTTAVLFTRPLKTGGNPFLEEAQHWSSQRVRLYPAPGKGYVQAIVTKNAFAPPPIFTIDLRFLQDATLDSVWELVNLAVKFEVIRKSGSWLFLDNRVLGQGADAAIRELSAQGLFGDLRERVLGACS